MELILISEKAFTDINYERLTTRWRIYKKIDRFYGNIYVFDCWFFVSNNIKTGSNNTTLRKVCVKSYGFDKIHLEKESKKIFLSNNKSIQWKKHYTYKVLFNTSKKAHPFYDGSGGTYEIFF